MAVATAAVSQALAAQPAAAHAATLKDDVRLFSFFGDLVDPLKHVAVIAWQKRGKLLSDCRSFVLVVGGTCASMPGRGVRVVQNPKLRQVLAEEEDPEALAAVAAGAGAAVCLGSAGALVGVATGATVGTVVGVVPALFTLGLSIPAGAIVGGAGGLACGAAVGGGAGFAGGAVAGFGAAFYRVEIRNNVLYVTSKLSTGYNLLVVQPVLKVRAGHEFTKESVRSGGHRVKAIAAERSAQVTTAGAVGGAVTVGVAGGACGTVVGGMSGAVLGLPLALFTFGLSIPIGAVIGGGAGLCVGAASGGTAGAVGGGAVAYTGYRCRSAPGNAANFVKTKALGTKAVPKALRNSESSSGGTAGRGAKDNGTEGVGASGGTEGMGE